jgi:hypothetical protein
MMAGAWAAIEATEDGRRVDAAETWGEGGGPAEPACMQGTE